MNKYRNKIEKITNPVYKFGRTAKEWKQDTPNLESNMKDYGNIHQLVILSNLENINSEFIKQRIER